MMDPNEDLCPARLVVPKQKPDPSRAALDGETRELCKCLLEEHNDDDEKSRSANHKIGIDWLESNPHQLQEYFVINQFHSHFDEIFSRHTGPRSFCGAAAPVNAMLLQEMLSCRKDASVQDFVLEISENVETFARESEKAIGYYEECRRAYIAKTPALLNAQSKERYLNAWIANYEISDFLRRELGPEKIKDGDPQSSSILFLRCNQYPIRHEATYEEFDRMEEEARFGGRVKTIGIVSYKSRETSTIIEVIGKERLLLTPGEFFEKCRNEQLENESSNDISPRIAVVDLQGHYAVMICSQQQVGIPRVTLINTIGTGYLYTPMALACAEILLTEFAVRSAAIRAS